MLRLDDPRPFSREELIGFLAGCKAGEERACVELAGLIRDLGGDSRTADVLRQIYADEIRHVSFATEELGRLADAGSREQVVRTLRAARRAEARANRAVSRAFMARLMTILGAPAVLRWLGGLAIDIAFLTRWLFPGRLDRPLVDDPMPVASHANAASDTAAVLEAS